MSNPTRTTAREAAVVTGASKGIGAACARRLAFRGLHVVAVARTAAALDDVRRDIEAAGGSASTVVADLSDLAAVERVAVGIETDFGQVRVLVNNVGTLNEARRAERINLETWQRVLTLNLTVPFLLATRLRPLLSRGSVVINMSSTAAAYPSIGLAPYNVSKAGLDMLTRDLALEWAQDGIRVVGVAPGKIDTELGSPVIRYTDGKGLTPNPLGRVGSADEVAAFVDFLCGPDADFVTGTTHVVDGGELLGTVR